MIVVSDEFREATKERTNFMCNANISFADGSIMTLNESDFAIQGNVVVDSAGSSSLPLGAAISRSIQIELINDDERFAERDFLEALVELQIKFDLSKAPEIVSLGRFTVTTPESYGDTIVITANDDMYRADKKYTTALVYPATLLEMLQEICNNCGIRLSSREFRNSGFTINSAPSTEYTYRQIIGYIAMLAAGNARINTYGELEIITYDFNYLGSVHDLHEWKTLKVEANDVIITGLQTSTSATLDNAGETILIGKSGYVLNISNPLFSGRERDALQSMSEVLVGAAFRKFEGNYIAYPLAEFMDQVKITDRKGNTYYSVITDIEFEFFGLASFSNSAESAVRTGSSYSQPETNAVVASKELIGKSPGLYATSESFSSDSAVLYLHNKIALSDSSIVIRLQDDNISISIDGGNSYYFTGAVNHSDYVVETGITTVTGESGSRCTWDWIRWASGAIDLYGIIEVGSLIFTERSAGVYESVTPSAIKFPELLATTVPNIQLTALTSDYLIYGYDEAVNDTYIPKIKLISLDAENKDVKLAVQVFVPGKITEG